MLKCMDVKKLHNVFCMNICSNELLVFKLPYRTHNLIINRMVKTIEIRLHKETARLIYNLFNSSNNVKHHMFNNNSMLSEKFRYLCYYYKLTVDVSMTQQTKQIE